MNRTNTNNSKAYDRDRKRGFLTKKDWEMLVDSPDREYHEETRRRLRLRVRRVLLDFRVLFDNWNPDERDKAFAKDTAKNLQDTEHENPDGLIHADWEIYDGCVALVGLLFQQYYSPTVPDPEASFDVLLNDGIGRALETMDTDKSYFVEIEPVDRLAAEAREKYEQGEPLDMDDVAHLVNAGVIPAGDIPLRRPGDGGDGE